MLPARRRGSKATSILASGEEVLISIHIFVACNHSCQHCALQLQYGIQNPWKPPADSRWYDFLFPREQNEYLNLPCDIASNSDGLKPANSSPKISQRGSSSADLDRGVVSDDDDDDDAALEKAGMNASTSNVGKFSLRLGPTHQHPGHSSNSHW